MSWTAPLVGVAPIIREVAAARKFDGVSLLVPVEYIDATAGGKQHLAETPAAVLLPHYSAFATRYQTALIELQNDKEDRKKFFEGWASLASEHAEIKSKICDDLERKFRQGLEFINTAYGRLTDRLRITKEVAGHGRYADFSLLVNPTLLCDMMHKLGGDERRWAAVLCHLPVHPIVVFEPKYTAFSSEHTAFHTMMTTSVPFAIAVVNAWSVCCATDGSVVAKIKTCLFKALGLSLLPVTKAIAPEAKKQSAPAPQTLSSLLSSSSSHWAGESLPPTPMPRSSAWTVPMSPTAPEPMSPMGPPLSPTAPEPMSPMGPPLSPTAPDQSCSTGSASPALSPQPPETPVFASMASSSRSVELDDLPGKTTLLLAGRYAILDEKTNDWSWSCPCGAVLRSPSHRKHAITHRVTAHTQTCSAVWEEQKRTAGEQRPLNWIICLRDKRDDSMCVANVCHYGFCQARVDLDDVCKLTREVHGWSTFICPLHKRREGGCVNCKRKADKCTAMHLVPHKGASIPLCDQCRNLRTTRAQLEAATRPINDAPTDLPDAKRVKQ